MFYENILKRLSFEYQKIIGKHDFGTFNNTYYVEV